jgi:hypothetical protein
MGRRTWDAQATAMACPLAFVSALAAWIDNDNEHYLHSASSYKPPRQFERAYHASHSLPFVAAAQTACITVVWAVEQARRASTAGAPAGGWCGRDSGPSSRTHLVH